MRDTYSHPAASRSVQFIAQLFLPRRNAALCGTQRGEMTDKTPLNREAAVDPPTNFTAYWGHQGLPQRLPQLTEQREGTHPGPEQELPDQQGHQGRKTRAVNHNFPKRYANEGVGQFGRKQK